MTSINSRLHPAGSSSAISPRSSKKSVEFSPELQRKAEEITERVLSKMREHVRDAALHALSQQKNDSSAEIWMERRIFRPAQQLLMRAVQVKKPNLPPPSSRADKIDPEVTGTWRKVANSSRKASSPILAPQSMKRDTCEETISPLGRVLACPDRASVPAVRPPTPPPPSVLPKSDNSPAAKGVPHPLEAASVAPGTESPGTTATPLEPLESLIPKVASLPENLALGLDQRLSSLRNLDTPQKQGELLVELLLEVAPARLILLHTIDPRSQEATVIGAHGEHASTLAEWTTEPQDPLLTQLRRLRRPLKITAPSADERCRKGRWAVALPQKYLVAMPVLHDHKLLGFIELADPLNGNRFEHDQLETVSEIANAWGSRLA